jgi:putative sterol carrier protein
MAEQQISDQAQLATLVADKSDDELNAFLADTGVDAVFEPIFTGMKEHFLPEKAAGKSAVIQYDILLADGSTESWQVDVADGACAVEKGTPKEATVTLTLSAPNFLRLVSGKLNGVQAFMSGKLKIKGDMMLAQTMQGWFLQA